MRRLLVASAAAVGSFALAATLAAPAGWVVLAHSQLVSSTPGSGDVVAEPPSRIVLVFSEPVDGAHTSLDLLDAKGAAIATAIGAPEPGDPRTFAANVSPLADGAYTVNWRALSATDGHATSGSFSFGVGHVAAGSLPIDVGAGSGDLHAGHDAGQILLEVQGRALSDAGFMLAFGLMVVAAIVVEPAGLVVGGLLATQLAGLAVGGAAAIALGLASGATPGLDPVGYLASTRSGGLLLARAGLALAGLAAALVASRFGRRRTATVLAGTAGAGGLVLVALGGHVAAAAAIGPVGALATIGVHLAAASVWLAGVAALAGLAVSRSATIRSWLPAAVPRFSALALVSVALVVATGIYIAWLETGDLTTLDSQYAIALLVKVGLVAAALVLGALNLLGRGLTERRAGGFERRIVAEAVILGAVIVATANIASGSPPGPERPVPLAAEAPAAGSAGAQPDVSPTLALEPGRAGPNAWWVTLPSGTSADSVELRLDRLDQAATAEDVVPLRALPGHPGTWVATGGLLPPGSVWDASVVASAGGREIGRSAFHFSLDSTGVEDGRAGLPIDPAVALVAALVVASVVGLAFAFAGGSLPWVERVAGRRVLVAGGLVGASLAVALLVGSVAR